MKLTVGKFHDQEPRGWNQNYNVSCHFCGYEIHNTERVCMEETRLQHFLYWHVVCCKHVKPRFHDLPHCGDKT